MANGRQQRKYRLDQGLQEILQMMVEASKLDSHVASWKAQIQAGEIDGETREILIAVGWVTYRDSRMAHLTAVPRKRIPTKPADGAEESPV